MNYCDIYYGYPKELPIKEGYYSENNLKDFVLYILREKFLEFYKYNLISFETLELVQIVQLSLEEDELDGEFKKNNITVIFGQTEDYEASYYVLSKKGKKNKIPIYFRTEIEVEKGFNFDYPQFLKETENVKNITSKTRSTKEKKKTDTDEIEIEDEEDEVEEDEAEEDEVEEDEVEEDEVEEDEVEEDEVEEEN